MNGGDIMIDSMNVASYYLGKESMPLQKTSKAMLLFSSLGPDYVK